MIMRPASQTRPTFLWQGLLILLPVALLSALGLLSLRQDRRLAEQDARQRAREMVRQLASAVAERVGSQMLQFERDAQVWDNLRRRWRPRWPEGGAVRIWQVNATNAEDWASAWTLAHENLNPDEELLSGAMITDQADWIVPRLWSRHPTPPAWWSAMPAQQMEQWQAARALEARGASLDEISVAWRNLLGGEPGTAVSANADLAMLRLETSTNSTEEAVIRLTQFSQEHEEVASETGLPLSAVALVMALNRGGPLNESLLQTVERQLTVAPSLLCPYFIAECEQRADSAPEEVKGAVPALRKIWKREERLRELVAAMRERVGDVKSLTANVWLTVASNRWLAVPHPNRFERRSPLSGEVVPVHEGATLISFFPKPALEQMFEEALRANTSGWPSYLAINPELEGESMSVPAAGDTLASQAGAMNASVSLMVTELDPAGNHSEWTREEHPAWAAPPRFALTACLPAPGELYARQRTRSLWFGGLITAVAATAVVGFVRARRAFWREHQLSELKTNFVSSVSHELRAPIASVRLMAESLERGKVDDPARQREYFRLMVQECRRLTSLVANVLDFSRIEQGRKQYDFEPTDVAELVRQTMTLMAPHAAEREISLAEAAGAGAAPLQPTVDGRALQQALVNLLDNALKHAPPRTAVTVGLETGPGNAEPGSKGGRWRLWVQDCGPGIPPSEHVRIFERFYRLGSELRRDTQGVGIGLSIVKHIVEAHQGRVIVESAPGQGSRFTMEFPAHE